MLPSESNAGNAIVSTDTPNPPSPTADERAADVAARVNQAWDRIEAFASRKHPPLLASLRPGVDPTLLAKFEATFGLRFPAGLRASLLRHDGQEHLVAGKPSLPLLWLFGAYRLNNLASMAETAEEWKSWAALGEVTSSGQWMPIASSTGGEVISVDLATDRLDIYQHDDETGELSYPFADLGQHLHWLADELEGGKMTLDAKTGLFKRPIPRQEAVLDCAEEVLDEVLDAGGAGASLVRAVSARLGEPAWLIGRRYGYDLAELVEEALNFEE
jgi:cell wall assembly regulator SMI1